MGKEWKKEEKIVINCHHSEASENLWKEAEVSLGMNFQAAGEGKGKRGSEGVSC